jgi:Na+-translocating ferredoxin:NAD+ oxidoreductase subunit G
MKDAARHAIQGGLLLGLVALLAVSLLVGIESLTRERIEQAEHAARLAALTAVLPADSFDNDPLHDAITVVAPGWLGNERPLALWRARRGDAPSHLVVQAVAPRGYGGPIELLVGIDAEGRVAGVRVTRHQETPGLGDAIEARRSDWIERFRGRSLGDPPAQRWRVRRDGGDFDQFTGATITPRAVVAAVAATLAFVEAHGEALYAARAGTELRFDDGLPPLPRP